MLTVPSQFAAGIRAREGESGRAWLAALPGLVSDLCSRWRLSIDGEPRHGHLAIVVPVQRDGEPCSLKVSWQNEDTAHEARALGLWSGRDVVEVLESSPDDGAMLLERLDANRSLFGLPLDQAFPVAIEILRDLAIAGDDTLPTADRLAMEIARTAANRWSRLGSAVIPGRHLDKAIRQATDLSRISVGTMVHWDLHYGNVLFSPARQKWVAIDPKPVTGCPESGIAPLFWTRISDFTGPAHLRGHLDALIEAAELDDELTRAWMHARVVDFWLWELGVGLVDDPGGCATILDWLAP